VFVVDDLGAWLVGLLADAGRKKLTALVIGGDQERALRKAADDAVQDTVTEMDLSAEQARQLAIVIREAFRKPVQETPLPGSVTMLELLQAGIARQLVIPDDSNRAAARRLSAGALGLPEAALAEKLTGHVVRRIMLRGSGGGPLTPLADQLNHDLTHLQGQRVEGMLARLVAFIDTASASPADAGSVRVSEADPRLLGVHAAISVPGVPDEIPPEYVPRDLDADEHGVRAKMTAAAARGGFVLLVGGSSVGKTRCAAEAVKALLPDWWLVHPTGPAEVAALAASPPSNIVIWLDELQRYLDGEHGLAGGTVRALLNAVGPVVIIGTLWPDRYNAYAALPADGDPDPYSREREVLDLAAVIRISEEFSTAEQDRARDVAARDLRIRAAMEAAGYGLTQTLAAAPQLVARWDDARTASPYAWAVLTAALDAARLGARAPLTADFLRAAAPGYCTPRQQAEAPDNWFGQAMVYATAKLHGAAAALAPAGAGMGQTNGYTVADYLLQYASKVRRSTRPPASTWDAMLSHICDAADVGRLATSARDRLLYRYAISLYQLASDAVASFSTSYDLADLLARRGDLGQLRARADNGDANAAYRLADLLVGRGDLEEAEQVLSARTDAASGNADNRLVALLDQHGVLDELRARADAGDGDAANRLLARKRLDELRARADAGDDDAAKHLADSLGQDGDLDELRARADAGDRYASFELASLLAGFGGYRGLDELRARVDYGDLAAADRLADVVALRGNPDELRARADAGHSYAAFQLADLLGERSDLDELRARADAGDHYAARRLAGLLADHGDLHEAERILHAQADIGYGDGKQLAELLAQQGREEAAERVRRFGLAPDGSIARG
jgi:hypothetical protein